MSVPKVEELFASIVRSLVDNPDDVRIQPIEGSQSTVLEIHVNQHDTGQIIGRKGKTANALRTISNSIGARTGRRLIIEIME